MSLFDTLSDIKRSGGTQDLNKYLKFFLDDTVNATTALTGLVALYVGLETGEDRNGSVQDLVQRANVAPPASVHASLRHKQLKQREASEDEDYDLADVKPEDNQMGSLVAVDVLDARRAEAVLFTAYFLALFRPVDHGSPQLKAVLQRAAQLQGATSGSLASELGAMVQSEPQSDASLITLVTQAATVAVPELALSVNVRSAALAAPSLIHQFLQQAVLQDPADRGPLVMRFTTKVLQHSNLPESQVLVLLHMLRSFLRASPLLSRDQIDEIERVVRDYYLWPLPVGESAGDLLRLLRLEKRAPGFVQRELVLEENPDLTETVGRGGGQQPGKERIVHVLLDANTQLGRRLQDTLRSQPAPDLSNRQLQQSLLASMLRRVLHLSAAAVDLLQWVPSTDIAKAYVAAIDALDQAVLMTDDAGAAHCKVQLQTIYNQLQSVAGSSQTASKTCPPVAPPLQFSFQSLAISNEQPRSRDDIETWENLRLPRRGPAYLALLNILGQYSSLASPTLQPIVRIAIAGGDAILHNVLTAYIALKLLKPALLRYVNVRFFLVPVDESALATFFGRKDVWYARHILLGVPHCLRTFPRLSSQGVNTPLAPAPGAAMARSVSQQAPGSAVTAAGAEFGQAVQKSLMSRAQSAIGGIGGGGGGGGGNTSSGRRTTADGAAASAVVDGPFTPALMLRSLLQDYVRESQWPVPLNVYQCECWLGDGSGGGGGGGDTGRPDFTVPFCTRVTLGQAAAARRFQRTSNLDVNMTLDEIVAQKGFKFSGATATVRYTPMNEFGFSTQPELLPKTLYHTLCVANVWAPRDPVPVANPCQPWLEVYGQELDVKKGRAKLCQSRHAGHLEIEVEGKKGMPVDLLIDDQLYGPVTRVRISAFERGTDDTDETMQTFRFYSFLPFVF